MKKILFRFWPYLLLFLASLFPFWLNISTFDPKGIFNLRDFNLPFDILSNLKQMLFTWNPNLGFGYSNFSVNLILIYQIPLVVLRSFGLSLLNVEKIYLSSVLFIVGLGSFWFLNYYLNFSNGNVKKIAILLGSFFYMFNIPLNNRFIGVPHTAIVVGLFPIMLIIVDKIIKFNSINFKQFILDLSLSFLLTFSLASDLSVSYMFFLAIGLFALFTVILNKRFSKIFNLLLNGLIVVVITILLNSFWLFPIFGDFLKGKSYYKDIVETGYNARVFNKNFFAHDSPLDVLRLHWGKDSFDAISMAKENYYPKVVRSYYDLPIDTILFFGLIVWGLLISFKDKENKKKVLIITALGVIGLLFSFGGKAPLDFWKIHTFLFNHFPGFTVLRTFLKFQDLQVFWYMCFLVFVTYFLLEKFGRKTLGSITVILIVLFFIIQGALPWFLTNLAGRLEFFVLPDYYWQAKKWLDEQGQDFRFVVFPQGEWTETYEWGPKYELVPIYRNFFNQPSLYQEPVDATGGKLLIDPISNFEISNLSKYLKVLGVKYVLVRKDISPLSVYPQFNYILENMPDYLESNGYKLIKSFDEKLFFYEFPGNDFLPEVYIPDKVNFLSDDKNIVKYLFNSNGSNGGMVFLSKENSSNQKVLALSESEFFTAKQTAPGSVYTVDLPKSGDYRLFLRPSLTDRLIDYKKSSLFGKDFYAVSKGSTELSALSVDNFWWNYGSLNLNEGKNNFQISSQRVNLVSDQNWKTQNSQDGKSAFLVQQINSWTPDYSYRITFDYLTDATGADFVIVEQKYKMTKEMLEYSSWQEALINNHLMTNGKWERYDQTVTSGFESVGAGAIIANADTGTKVSNIVISPIFKPMVFLQSITGAQAVKIPDVKFKKINPTKFEVNIENITQPFILVLNDSFNKNWTAEVNNSIIVEENHLVVNGFANGWYLEPKDFFGNGGKVILNFYPQQLFNVGVLVSLGTVLLSGFLVLIFTLKSKRNK